MRNYHEGSLIITGYKRLREIYLNSFTCSFLKTVSRLWRYSITQRILNSYLLRESSLKHSRTYRVLSGLFNAFDKVWDKLYNFVYRDIKNSKTAGFFSSIAKSTGVSIFLSIPVLFFTCSYGIMSIISGTFTTIKILVLVSGFIVTCLLLVGDYRWKACFNNSLFVRILLYIFD